MGGALSKKIPIPRNLSKAIDSYESKMAKDALDDIARKESRARAAGAKYSDPNALDTGFKRDGWVEGKGEGMAQESRQRDFLNDVNQGADGSNGPEEMPKDLLDFLNAAGPLERKVDKSMTSPKVYESLLDKEEEEAQKQQANQRTRRRMPMVEHKQQQHDMSDKKGGEVIRGGADDLEFESEEMKAGLTTTRTTSFSSAIPKEEEDVLKLTDSEMFQFLAQVGHNDTSHEEFLKRKFLTDTNDDDDDDDDRGKKEDPRMAEEEMRKNLIWLEHICKYNGIPVLLQDTDKSLVGTWAHNVKDLEKQKLYLAKNEAKLAIQNEVERLAVDGGGNF